MTNLPDRSDGLREALERLENAAREYKDDGTVDYGETEHPVLQELEAALAAARLALKAESK